MKDTEIQFLINKEQIRQTEHIELIASENYVSQDVLAAQGSILTNKYAEGYAGKRYYGGCEVVDKIEEIAISRACALFSCDYANVQPHSGSQANFAVYSALLETGDTVLSMDLTNGGHLTHGSKVNASGKLYNFVHYKLDYDGLIDYERIQDLAIKHKPKLIVAGYSAYSRELDIKKFRKIADKVGALLMVDMAHFAGFVAGGFYKNPLEFADVVTSTTHKTLRGPRGGLILTKGKDDDFNNKLDSAIFPNSQGGPLLHVIAAKAVCFKEAMTYEYRVHMSDVKSNAIMSAQVFKDSGFKIVSDGTDNHMFLVDLTDKGITGKDAETWLGKAGITVNKNTVPNDKESPMVTSGIRIGLSAITTRGMHPEEITMIMQGACDVINTNGDENEIQRVKELCHDLTIGLPIHPVVKYNM